MNHLLALLRKDARISLEDAAKQLDLTPEQVADYMQELEETG